jgi:hypothetical protein
METREGDRSKAAPRCRAGWIAAVGLASVLAAASCGFGESSPPPPAPPEQPQAEPAEQAKTDDACKLLTQAEVEEALGGATQPGDPNNPEMPSSCSWFLEGRGDAAAFVNAEIVPGGRPAYDAEKSTKAAGADPVPDLGDDAYKVDEGQGTRIAAVEGEKVVEVIAPSDARAEELARKALARL